MSGYLFILGAGCSVDCGLKIYKGNNSLENVSYATTFDNILTIWEKLTPLFNDIQKSVFGETYQLLQKIVNLNENCTIITQNIDGHILNIKNANIVELHGNINTMYCEKCNFSTKTNLNELLCNCGSYYRPNITIIGENLNNDTIQKAKKLCKIKYKGIIVIGTILQFEYLISLAKGRVNNVIHINPDIEYNNNIIYKHLESYSSLGKKFKAKRNVRKNEIWINKTSSCCLKELFNLY